MRPVEVTYRLADPIDKPVLQALLEKSKTPMKFPLSWLCVVADRKGKLEGFINVNLEAAEDYVLMEPLVSSSPIITMRLVEAMELLLRENNVSTYFFRVEDDQDIYLDIIAGLPDEYKFVKTDPDNGDQWFRRDLT